MCGGHGVHHLISLVAAESGGLAQGERIHPPIMGGAGDVENEVMLMYARGEIGAEAFLRLRVMAQERQLTRQELGKFRHAAIHRPDAKSENNQIDESVLTFRRQLQAQQDELEAACTETEESLRRLQLETAALCQIAGADHHPPKNTEALQRIEAAEQRIAVIQERLANLRASLASVTAQKQILESKPTP